MKALAKHIILLLLVISAAIQKGSSQCTRKYDFALHRVIYTKADVMPQFPGGMDGWRRYTERNLLLPDNFLEGGNCGQQLTYKYSLVVEQNGSLSNIIIRDRKDTSQFCAGDKALYYLLKGSPRWAVGKCNNKAVAVKMEMVFIMEIQ